MGTVRAIRKFKQVGNFEVLRDIGEGGMGVVQLARQPALERLVVLKKIRQELTTETSIIERFQREARSAAAVHHQNVVAVYDCFSSRGDHYIAQEYVDGKDLRAILKQLGRLEPRVAALIALEVARGLEEIHARAIVHRDLKPANVLISRSGEVKIADFGIALETNGDGLTRPGVLLGSVPYMSPEQIMGERVDSRTDLFCFGILLYEMICGIPPFRESADDATDTLLERIQTAKYIAPRKRVPSVPRWIARMIRRCLRGKIHRRAQTATLIRKQLESYLGTVSPADCRSEIAAHMAERGVLEEAEGTATSRVEVLKQSRRAILRGRIARILPAASGAALVVALVAVTLQGRLLSIDLPTALGPSATEQPSSATPSDPGPASSSSGGAPTTPAVAPDPARVWFVAYPWAEVRIDNGDAFHTPRAESVAVTPGAHRVKFRHPKFGDAWYDIEVKAGEHRIVRHVYDGANKP